ncbi:hypothetical protein [Chengkuizengella axinellae]|uniref:DUF2059 domain-containing protein n=1 Tax=Chengkuizengella axinellae TaxID=3064388 RepID=A0ABT9IW61_9BACL|nr:hypothetical protein [Chengkuizengella sp. 2205SS18-9]MDP5273586.1 hypothetical protein [Chengkuizengella sp. 2205SS18-9]
MKKIILVLLVLIISNSVTFMVANKESLEEDFLDFHGRWILIQDEEEELVMSLFESVTGENFQNDEILYETLTQEIIPRHTLYQQIYSNINYKHFDTEEVQDLVNNYQNALGSRLGAFNLLKKGIEQNDEELKNRAYESIGSSIETIEEFYEIYNELQREYAPRV